MDNVVECDALIVGAGPAGLTAALYLAEHGYSVKIVDQGLPGGQVVNSARIRGIPGLEGGLAGFDFGAKALEELEDLGGEFVMDRAAELRASTVGQRSGYRLRGEFGSEVTTRAVVVATGSIRRSVDVPGIAEFQGRGVWHCAACEGQFLSGGRAAVVGGGDAAHVEALELLKQGVSEVLLINRGGTSRARKSLRDAVGAAPGIVQMHNSLVVALEGAGNLEGIRILRDGCYLRESIDGVFICIGLEPSTHWLSNLIEVDPSGHLLTDNRMQTSLPGLFAAGDVRADSAAQVVSSMGDGATAGSSAARYLGAEVLAPEAK